MYLLLSGLVLMTELVREDDNIKIITLLPEHAEQVAKLHISGIATGFISSLGTDFVKALYCAIAESEHSVCLVVVQDNKVLGFASFTTDLNKLYKSLIFKRGLKFFLMLCRKMFSVRTVKKIFETMFYPARIKKMSLPEAEFLSMAIADEARGKGLATKLVRRGFEECAKLGVKELKIFAAVDIQAINNMYKKLGFRLAGQMENHGVVSNVYVARTDHFEHH
jgi:ribosomal protein S18 acetylase RimI-like enzyme